MGIKNFFKKAKQGFVINEVEKIPFPKFEETNIYRKHYTISDLPVISGEDSFTSG